MTEEFYFMALAGLGVSLAGFAGLIAALDRRPAAAPEVAAWRLRNIVIGGFILTIAGFATVALFRITGDNLELTARLTSALLALANLIPIPVESRAGPAWPNERGRRLAIAASLLIVAADIGNVFLGRLGYLQLLFLLQLLGPVSIFFNSIRDVAGAGSGSDDGPGPGTD